MISEASPNHSPECEHCAWYESVNKAMPVNTINEMLPFLSKETVDIVERTFKNIKKNYGSKSNE